MGDSDAFTGPARESAPLLSPSVTAPDEVESQRLGAVQVLRRCIRPTGIRASARAHGHDQIWARDSNIALLGASLLDDELIHGALCAGLRTLSRHQSPAGLIPNHVDLATGHPNFRAYADAGLWHVIGSSILMPDYLTTQRVLRWYECQDVDATGLLSIQEASDWQDLFCVRGKGLYVNCLHVIALERAAIVASDHARPRQAERYRRRAECARAAINRRLWHTGDGEILRHVADSFSTPNQQHDSLGRRRWIPAKRILRDVEYYLSYVSFREIGEWFDTLGNLLAILAGVADARQTASILDFIAEHDIAAAPCRAIYPAVFPGDHDWRDYYGALNLPNQYHNGGVWPFIGGFYVAALVRAGRLREAERTLVKLAEWNRRTEFCEWLDGCTLEPKGVREQAWSAGMYLFAAACVDSGSVPYF